ncbi:hypothetical protein [Ralstonia wenshanensis]|uniref:hypothetical protein n=1 Tax=Ralstonia wenshanensis TaxID=2842456 RepID=UPI0021B375E6|nr:hypothetical protein [Ralstonia wenshanensis]MCT7307385.1 hypothetical protein [Ralstonia wenshanensis]
MVVAGWLSAAPGLFVAGGVLPSISRQEFETSCMQDVMPGRLVICKDEVVTESVDPEAF